MDGTARQLSARSRSRLEPDVQNEPPAGDVTRVPGVESVAFTTDSPEKVAARLRRFWTDEVVVPQERGRIGYELTALCSPRLSIGKVGCRVGRTSRASVAQPMLQVPLDCSADFRIGRTKVAIGPGDAVLLPPGHEYTAHISAGSALFIQVDTAVLVQGLPSGRAGRPRHWVSRCVPIDVSGTSATSLLTEVGSLLKASEFNSIGDRAAAFVDAERRLVSWLTGALLDRGGLRISVPAASELAERADEWIESNLSSPITLESLAGLFGVTGRWLQMCFMARWGVAPMDRVTFRRLALARSCLLSPDGPSVTSVAVRCGFSHLGRFAGLYRGTFGESPSETVVGARRRRQLSAVAQHAAYGA